MKNESLLAMDAILIVFLRLAIIVMAFGLLATAFLIRGLIRRAYTLSIRALYRSNSNLQSPTRQSTGRTVGLQGGSSRPVEPI